MIRGQTIESAAHVGLREVGEIPSLFPHAVIIASFGFFLRLFFVVALGLSQSAETDEYERIAHNLLSGKGFGLQLHGAWYRTFVSFPYTYLCAFLYATFGHSYFVILAAQAFFSAITALACYSIGRRLFAPSTGLLAAVLVAFHPGLFFYDTHKLHPLGFDTTLAVTGVLMVLLIEEGGSWRTVALGGMLHGLSILERTTQVGLLPLSLLSIWYSRKKVVFSRLAAVYLIAVAAISGPWIVRNLILYQRPLLTSTAGEVFWRGNNPVASGGGYAKGRPGVAVFEAAPQSFRESILGKDEITQSEIFYQEAVRYIFNNPFGALELYGRKLWAFWWFSPHSGFLYPASYLSLYKKYYAVILVLGLIGLLVACRGRNRGERSANYSVISFLCTVALLQAAFYVEIRHRWGIEPLLLIFAAGGGTFLFRCFHSFLLPMVKRFPISLP